MRRHGTGSDIESGGSYLYNESGVSTESDRPFRDVKDSIVPYNDGASRRRGTRSAVNEPTAPSPSIRKELANAIRLLTVAAEAMQLAHEYDECGVDVVDLANSVDDYRRQLDVLWRYREFGTAAWRAVVVFSQQALYDNMRDEEMTRLQCGGLKRLATSYLSNRMLAKEDVQEVMTLLTESEFDPLLFFANSD